jgi:hypothetical protein
VIAARTQKELVQAGVPPKATVRLPIASDPRKWREALILVDKPWTALKMPSIGWHIYFIRTGAGPANPTITPSVTPVDQLFPKDKVISASVTLPEAGGLKQYWVPVREAYLGAQLQTAEWTVIFLRDPSP